MATNLLSKQFTAFVVKRTNKTSEGDYGMEHPKAPLDFNQRAQDSTHRALTSASISPNFTTHTARDTLPPYPDCTNSHTQNPNSHPAITTHPLTSAQTHDEVEKSLKQLENQLQNRLTSVTPKGFDRQQY